MPAYTSRAAVPALLLAVAEGVVTPAPACPFVGKADDGASLQASIECARYGDITAEGG